MSAASTPGNAPKAMSSRLLTMKFMQRAAHSTSSSPSTPDVSSAKRRRTDSASTPTRINVDSLADRTAIQSALAAEEAKRQIALEKQAAEAGDTRWVLSFEDQKPLIASPTLTLRVISAGFANLDSSPSHVKLDEDLEDKPVMIGRRSFGKFNRVIEKQQDPSLSSSESEADSGDDDDSSENESSSDSDNPAREMIKAERREATERAKAQRKATKRAAQSELEKAAKKRRKNDVNLNGRNLDDSLVGLTSLSGRQAPLSQRHAVPKDISCYRCGGNHFKKDCPDVKRGFQGGDDGPGRKHQKRP